MQRRADQISHSPHFLPPTPQPSLRHRLLLVEEEGDLVSSDVSAESQGQGGETFTSDCQLIESRTRKHTMVINAGSQSGLAVRSCVSQRKVVLTKACCDDHRGVDGASMTRCHRIIMPQPITHPGTPAQLADELHIRASSEHTG